MTDPRVSWDAPALLAEVARLETIVRVLADRAERSTVVAGSDFSLFQMTVLLEEQVRGRTRDLQKALARNESIMAELAESEAKFKGLVDQSLIGIAIIHEGRFTYANPQLCQISGYTADDLLGLGPQDLVVPAERAKITRAVDMDDEGLGGSRSEIYQGLRSDGSTVFLEMATSPMGSGSDSALIAVVNDISERVRAETRIRALNAQLQDLATRDVLTGLFNRRHLQSRLASDLAECTAAGAPMSVIMLDLDHFKDINDSLGHLVGDEVLREVGRIISEHVRATDMACRYGGEEFLVVLPGLSPERAVERAERLRAAIEGAVVTAGSGEVQVTASLGVAAFPDDGSTGEGLLRAADVALFDAKHSGRNRVAQSTREP